MQNAYKPTEERNQQNTCYVGNLDDQVTEALLWELMLQCGSVVNVHRPKDRVTHSHQGFGFAEFQTEDDADYAIKIMHMIKVYGKPISQQSERQQTFVAYDNFESADAAIEAMNGQFLMNKPITVSCAFKKDAQGERHRSAADRLLAAQAQKNAPTHMPNRMFADTPGVPGMPLQMAVPGMAPPPQGFQMPPAQHQTFGFPPMPGGGMPPMPGYQMPPPAWNASNAGDASGMPGMQFIPPPGFSGQYPPPQWPQR
ncbi:UNVERIFIED_CONTAM: Splicing factor 3B subunit 4 [Siphonaria sp. JEL0065]|nr:Splicing factor 3B subunit 4 [Siphonaria sp. JEL0065]